MRNVWAFRLACSSAFSPIEYCVAGDSTGLSVTLGLGERILNGELPELFMSNGYLVYKIQGKSDLFLLLDPVTGIVTDCALGIHGVYCYHDQITDTRIELAENLTSNDPNVQPEWMNSISNSTIMLGSFATIIGTSAETEGTFLALGTISLEAAMTFTGVIAIVVAPIAFLQALQPYAIEEAEQEGNFNTAEYLTNNDLKDQMWDVMLQCLGIGGPSQGVWDESYKYGSPNNQNVRQNLEDIKNLKEGAQALWNGLYNNLSCPYDRYKYEKAKLEWEEEYDTALSQPPTDPLGQFLVKLVKESVKKCDSGITKIKEGNIVGGAIDLALGTAGFDIVTATIIYEAWPKKQELRGGAISAGVLILCADGPPGWAALLIILGVGAILESEGVPEDPHNPRKWIKAGVDIGIAAIPGGLAAKELIIISETPWILMKSSIVSSGGQYVLKATVGGSFAEGTKKVAGDCLTSYTLDNVEDQIMDYMGVPTYI